MSRPIEALIISGQQTGAVSRPGSRGGLAFLRVETPSDKNVQPTASVLVNFVLWSTRQDLLFAPVRDGSKSLAANEFLKCRFF